VKARLLNSLESEQERKLSPYVILLGKPAHHSYSPVIHILHIGNPVGLDPNSENREDQCAPCASANLRLKEKIMSLDDTVLMEQNEDNGPLTNDEESVVLVF
jgi:hypothetical protein